MSLRKLMSRYIYLRLLGLVCFLRDCIFFFGPVDLTVRDQEKKVHGNHPNPYEKRRNGSSG
jgi:hypothetical protein